MIFRVHSRHEGFICNLLVWSWELGQVMKDFSEHFVNPVWDFHYQTVDID